MCVGVYAGVCRYMIIVCINVCITVRVFILNMSLAVNRSKRVQILGRDVRQVFASHPHAPIYV